MELEFHRTAHSAAKPSASIATTSSTTRVCGAVLSTNTCTPFAASSTSCA